MCVCVWETEGIFLYYTLCETRSKSPVLILLQLYTILCLMLSMLIRSLRWRAINLHYTLAIQLCVCVSTVCVPVCVNVRLRPTVRRPPSFLLFLLLIHFIHYDSATGSLLFRSLSPLFPAALLYISSLSTMLYISSLYNVIIHFYSITSLLYSSFHKVLYNILYRLQCINHDVFKYVYICVS